MRSHRGFQRGGQLLVGVIPREVGRGGVERGSDSRCGYGHGRADERGAKTQASGAARE